MQYHTVKINNYYFMINSTIKMNKNQIQSFFAERITDAKVLAEVEKTGANINSIVEQITQINEISSQNARNVEEIAAAADHLNSMTDDLHAKLETFRT